MIGHIKHTSKNQDYGFVTGEDQVDYFLHVRDTPDKNIPLVGTRISLDVTTGKDARPRAVNATPIDPAPVESWRSDLRHSGPDGEGPVTLLALLQEIDGTTRGSPNAAKTI